ncbi:hypothetical protein BAMA_24605 [Bacillus manliponensis]|uniref:DUF4274 domain-containing protein n=1 Tax=Bacillus manliponensis TaxID=574376 RepID=A0A073JVY3_9BACI|nr:DUF4274 domain-containing protein [Bacillus manliponensis]KEK19184.1 hypothetical protein BAMA_24605 [Bacillus manliponensis]
MRSVDMELLESLLYNEERDEIIRTLSIITNPLTLHIFAANYNWDDGLSIPTVIMENKVCDFGTGLLLFHDGDGYSMLQNEEDVLNSTCHEWRDFLLQLYNKITNLQFQSQCISFDPPLTKTQRYKLQKYNNVPPILINKSPGTVFDIPSI